MSLNLRANQSEREILVAGLLALDGQLARIQELVEPRPLVALRAFAVWVFDPESKSIQESQKMATDMTDNQTALIGPVQGIDADGNAEALPPLKAALLWALDDPTAGILTPSADSLSATFTPAKAPGHLGLQTIHYNTDTNQGDPDLKGVAEVNIGPGPVTGLTAMVTIQGNP